MSWGREKRGGEKVGEGEAGKRQKGEPGRIAAEESAVVAGVEGAAEDVAPGAAAVPSLMFMSGSRN